jgi:DNA invertase Pin-like site-specific DNA recombinase
MVITMKTGLSNNQPSLAALRIALYVRVSTKDQNTENQRLQLERYAAAMGWTVAHVYSDQESGAKAARPGFKALLAAAARHEFDLVLVWSLDRFTREGIGRTCDHLRALAAHKVAFRSFSEPFLDTGGPFAELVTAIFAFFADFERRRIIERVKAGQARARTQGKRIGGQNKLVFRRDQVAELRRQGLSLQRIADQLEVSKGTVINVLKAGG